MRRLMTGICLLTLLVGVPIARTTPAASASSLPSSLNLEGHGWGHGRGMGQYGALGYASAPYNWNYGQIIGHYYGGTKLVTVANRTINVNLTELSGASSIEVAAASGTLMIAAGSNPAKAVTSPWTVSRGSLNTIITTSNGSDVIVYSAAFPSGHRYFQGQILMAAAPAVVWNVVPLEEYVDGVVPRESPASWPAAALEAQAVAARSYALAYLVDTGNPAICDTTACQVYGGDPTQYGPESATFYQQSDAAVAATALGVLECNTDAACGAPTQIALTEFSSSTGGYTAGGAFPAVPDLGDATPSNPNHVWTAALSTAGIQAAFPSVGTLESVAVTGRNGLGDLGGRVTQMVLSGTAGQVTITGDQFAAAMGLKSDWFAFSPFGFTRVSVGSDGTVWILGTNPVNGGYGIYRLMGNGWQNVAGGAVVIAVGPTGNPWVANSRHQIYQWTGTGWALAAGAATDISVGSDGAVWAIGTKPVSGGYGIYRLIGNSWHQAAGGAVAIAVGPTGSPWVANSRHQIYQWTGTGWGLVAGGATDISVGSDGTVWVVGTNPVYGGYGIYRRIGNSWQNVAGGAVAIAVGPTGNAWVVNSAHQIYQWTGTSWAPVAGG